MSETRPVEPLLVVGTMRSGTTLLNRLLGAHPDIGMVYQPTHFFDYPDELGVEAFLGRFAQEYSRFGRMDAAVRTRIESRFAALGAQASPAERYMALLTILAGRDDLRIVGEKYAGRGAEMDPFRRLFPKGRILMVVRDPRDVLLSNKKRIEQESDMESYWAGSHLLVLDDWASLAVLHRAFNQAQSGGYLQIRYEDLVASPEEGFREICDFLGVPFSPRPLEPGSLQHDDGRAWRANTSHGEQYSALSASSVGAYRSKLSAAEVLLVDALLADHLKFFGYTLEKTDVEASDLVEACSLFLKLGATLRRFGVAEPRLFKLEGTEDENLLWFLERVVQLRGYGREDFLKGFLVARGLAARGDVEELRKDLEQLRATQTLGSQVEALRVTIEYFPTFLNVLRRLFKKIAP